MIRERAYYAEPRVRIPIRRWEKVKRDPFPSSRYNDRYAQEYRDFNCEDLYRLEVVFNGEVLSCNVAIPSYLGDKDPEALRKHIVESMSRQIASVVADEIRRSIA